MLFTSPRLRGEVASGGERVRGDRFGMVARVTVIAKWTIAGFMIVAGAEKMFRRMKNAALRPTFGRLGLARETE
jgi:hypothetical protein